MFSCTIKSEIASGQKTKEEKVENKVENKGQLENKVENKNQVENKVENKGQVENKVENKNQVEDKIRARNGLTSCRDPATDTTLWWLLTVLCASLMFLLAVNLLQVSLNGVTFVDSFLFDAFTL